MQIIIADNASTDNTGHVVAQISDSRLRYYRHEHTLDPNDNFNFCLSHADGEYFALLHDDDLMDDDFIETCMRAATHETEPGIIRTGARTIDAAGTTLREIPNRVRGLAMAGYLRGWFAGDTALYHSRLFSAHRLREIGGFRSKHLLLQDVAAEVRLAAAFGRVDIEAVKFSVRRHTGAKGTAADMASWCDEALDVLELLRTLVPPGEAEAIRREGKRFFAKLGYSRARTREPILRRLKAYGIVYRKFGYPPARSSLEQEFGHTSVYSGVRAARLAWRRLFARAAAAE